MKYQGSCHCQKVTFEIEAPEDVEVEDCNCSICTKSGYLHLIIPKASFKLLSGKDNLTIYTFNTKVAQHQFCQSCGIKPFYTPRSNPDGIDININCLDTKPKSISMVKFDDQNWEEHAHKLAYKSKST